jgi:hypothetical protein
VQTLRALERDAALDLFPSSKTVDFGPDGGLVDVVVPTGFRVIHPADAVPPRPKLKLGAPVLAEPQAQIANGASAAAAPQSHPSAATGGPECAHSGPAADAATGSDEDAGSDSDDVHPEQRLGEGSGQGGPVENAGLPACAPAWAARRQRFYDAVAAALRGAAAVSDGGGGGGRLRPPPPLVAQPGGGGARVAQRTAAVAADTVPRGAGVAAVRGRRVSNA